MPAEPLPGEPILLAGYLIGLERPGSIAIFLLLQHGGQRDETNLPVPERCQVLNCVSDSFSNIEVHIA